ncbi:phage tail tape measure protein [Sphingomonas sp. Leaf242]|uniref:phage tail tape measure protein n=1 Tax=Sphingomonas sp. Leaf242 TaxID=1736304 RepID=UPI000712E7DA|nr:phage tail tape measure protein [Sphingomonas sp. Leaf242]KQO07867.1 phage tail tape measure protein [Sphingomonas sp. Leaf242]
MADRNLRIRMLLEAGDKVTRPLRDIANGSSRTAQALKLTRDKLKEIERAQADVGGFRELKAGLRTTEQAMQSAQTKVGRLAQEIEQTATPTRAMTREFERAKREEQQLTRQHDLDGRALQELSLRLHTAGVDVNDLAGHERRLRTDAMQTNRELQEQSRQLEETSNRQRRFGAARDRFTRGQGLATGMAAGGAASLATGMVMARPILGGIEQAQAFQSGMTDIAQKADLTRVQADKMGASLLIAARAANQMPEDLQKGVDTLSGFGLDPTKATQMMKPIGRAATAYKAEIDDLSAAAFAANDNLKVPISQTGKVIDIMAEAGKAGAFEIKDMAGAFPSLTAGYQALGQTGTRAVADLAAALQIARKGAGDSASAATNVSNIIQKISSPATIKAFSKFGIDLPKALKKAYAEGKTPLEAIAELTKKATKGDLGKLGFLFEDSQVQQGQRPIIQNLKEYRDIRAKAQAANGTTDTDFAERMKDSAEQTKALKVNAAALAISLGNTLLPTVNVVLERAGAFADRLATWSQQHPALTRGIVLFAGGLSALFIVLGIGAIALAGIVGPMYLFAAAATYTEMALLPIIGIAAAIVLGIAALAIGVYAIYSNWGAITGWFAGIWAGLKAIVGSALGWFSALPARFGEFGRNIIAGMIGGITGMLGQLKASITGAASSAATWFKEKLGIHSPSRVFAGFGGFMMEGLSNGIDGGAGEPVRRLDSLSRRMTAAIAVGTAVPAMATGVPAGGPSNGLRASAPLAAPAPITIKVYGAPGQSAEDIAKAVRDALAEHQREQAANGRSAFADKPDWE